MWIPNYINGENGFRDQQGPAAYPRRLGYQAEILGGTPDRQEIAAGRLSTEKGFPGLQRSLWGLFSFLLGSYKHNPPFPAQPPSIYGRRFSAPGAAPEQGPRRPVPRRRRPPRFVMRRSLFGGGGSRTAALPGKPETSAPPRRARPATRR